MNSIRFKAAYGDETKIIEISRPHGAGNIFTIQEVADDNKYWHIGSVVYYIKGWTPVSQKRDFTADDRIAILERMIEGGLIGPDEKISWTY